MVHSCIGDGPYKAPSVIEMADKLTWILCFGIAYNTYRHEIELFAIQFGELIFNKYHAPEATVQLSPCHGNLRITVYNFLKLS